MLLTKTNLILGFILLLALFLRSYRLDTYPPLNPDEAAIGYNAYSLLQTGKDEHGSVFPIHFKSFGDYKPGGYFYLALPFVKILGLNPLAVRLPNLVLSIMAIFYFFLIVRNLSNSPRLSLISALVLSLNPWHIHFSRGGWESSVALSLIIIGTYYFLKRKYYLFIIAFVLSLYIYHSARILAPLLGLYYLFIHRIYFLKHRFKLIILIIFAAVISLPVFYSFLNNGGAARFSGVGITADQGPIWRANELINQHQPYTYFDRIIHNRRVLYFNSWIQKYTSHFDFNFLFLSGDTVPRSKVPDMGQFYLFELPLFLFGIYLLIHKPARLSGGTLFIKHKSLFIIWLLIAPLASSLTFQAPSALRSLGLVIPFSFFISLSIYHLKSKLLLIAVFILYLLFLIYYLYSYHYLYQRIYPQSWGHGFDQIIPLIESQKNNYNHIYFTDKYDQPYIMYLFYSQYSPTNIQSQISLTPPDQFGFSTVRQIDNIIFQHINWDIIPSNSLVVASDEPVPIDPKITLDFPNGTKAFKIYIKP